MATPTPGTFPSFPPYQPGALTYSGSEIGLLVTSATATAAATYQDTLFNMANKPTLTGPQALPTSNDLIAFFQIASNLPMVTSVGNIGITAGNIPTGGGTGTLLSKLSGVNYNASWSPINMFVSVGTGLATSGSATALVISVTGPLATTFYTAHALLLGEGTALVAGVNSTTAGYPLLANGSTTDPSYQALGLQSAFVTGILNVVNGGLGVGSLASNAVLLGNTTSPLAAVAATTAGYPLLANGSLSAPSYQSLSLAGAAVTGTLPAANMTNVNIATSGAGGVTGVLPVSNGGIGTSTMSANALVLGNGSNTVGLVPATTAGYFLSSQGSASPPAYTTIAGALAGFGLTGNTTQLGISTTAPPYGLDAPVNLGLSASIGTAALTINFLNNQGGTPTATSPILVGFQATNATAATPGWAAIQNALSMTVTQSATLGQGNVSAAFRYWICLFYQNATQVMPALINCVTSTQIFSLVENQFATTVAIGSTAFSAGVFYSPNGTNVNNAPFRIAGYVEYGTGLQTPGYYSTAPTALKLFSMGMKKPGDVVQVQIKNVNATQAFATAVVSVTNMSASISPTSAPNFIKVTALTNAQQLTAGSGAVLQIYRSTAATPSNQVGACAAFVAPTPPIISNMTVEGFDMPGTTAAVQYTLYASALSAVLFNNNGTTPYGTMQLQEIMG